MELNSGVALKKIAKKFFSRVSKSHPIVTYIWLIYTFQANTREVYKKMETVSMWSMTAMQG